MPYIFCVLALLAFHGAANAQEKSTLRPVTRSELWMSASGSYKPFNRKRDQDARKTLIEGLQLLGELGWRNRLDPLANKYWYGSVGTKLKLNDLIKVGAEYRHSFRDRYHTNTPRLDLQMWLSWKKDRVSLAHRFEYEHEFIPVTKMRTVLRNRLGVEYNIPNWKPDPHVSAEAFTGLHYSGNELIGMRYELGTELNLDKKKRRTLGLAVRYDKELNTAGPKNRWLFVISFEQEFKKK